MEFMEKLICISFGICFASFPAPLFTLPPSDQPLVHFFNNVFLEATDEETLGAGAATVAAIDEYSNTVNVGKLSTIGFQRTIRVPDNNILHDLPPDLGPFELFNVGDAVDHLPMPVVAKGGVFMSMYQREAMWISLSSQSPCAVKVSVGGINALTGTAQDASSKGKQDYLAVGGLNGQIWLDGISTAPGFVRQFVAMPLGEGYTVEGQLTGKETEGGVQIDVYPI